MTRQMKRTLRTAAMCFPLAAIASCAKPPQLPSPPTTISVRTAVVQAETVKVIVKYPGFTASPRSIEIDARVEGFLLKQETADGAVTKPGEVIYRIDPRQYEATLAGTEGSLAQAIAARDYAKKEMERNAPLVAANAISQQTFDRLVANYQESEGQVLTADANVTQAKLNLSYCTMQSPFVGLLGPSAFFEGAVVGKMPSVNLNSLVQLDPMWAQFSPAASDWPKFAGRMKGGPLHATVTYGGNATISTPATVTFIDNQASTQTATLMMRVEFANPTGIFRPGVYVDVALELGEQPNTVVVPQEAVFARETELYVWRVKADNTVEAVEVKVLRKMATSIALVSGPSAGDRVVTEGIQKLKPGTKVTEAPAPSANAPSTPAKASSPPAKAP